MKKFILFFIVSIFALNSCKRHDRDINSPRFETNNKPGIVNLSANPSTIKINELTTLSCVATDRDRDRLFITWTSKAGIFPEGNVGPAVKWKASSEGNYSINVIVSDGIDTERGSVNVLVQQGGIDLNAPLLLSPVDGVTGQNYTLTFSWTAVGGATSYNLQLATDNSFSGSSLFLDENVGNNSSKQLSGLIPSTKYYWRVSAASSIGVSVRSGIRSFTTTGSGGQPCAKIPTVTYMGKTYNTIQIVNQCWLKENLDVGTMIQGNQEQTNNGTIEKYCYSNSPQQCTTYGGLYQWSEVMKYSTTPGAQGICPDFWHIPTEAEFQTLKTAVHLDGSALSAEGTNTSGFSALRSGTRYYTGFFISLGSSASFWTSTEQFSTEARIMILYGNLNPINFDNGYKIYGYSVRCIKDN